MATRVLYVYSLLVLIFVNDCLGNGLKCVCNSSECEVIKPRQCPGRGLIVLDPCECCWVCARTLGEPCGGPGGFSGRCEPPYHCLESPTRNVGVCQRLPSDVRNSNKNCSHMQLIQGGCNIVERKCVCEKRPSLLCTDDHTRWYYRDLKECQYNLQAIIQQELEAENQETISEVSALTESVPCKPDDPTCKEDMQGDDPCAGGQCPSNESLHTCPPDSYVVADGNTTRCACKPCASIEGCKEPLKLKFLKSQNGEPGSCCDQYECTLREVCGGDTAENDREGAIWMKDACTQCTCRGGYSYCSQILDCHSQEIEIAHDEDESEGPSGCFAQGSLKRNGERWHEDRSKCTECVCERGKKKCTTSICKLDCPRTMLRFPDMCCPVCPPPCPEVPVCGPDDITHYKSLRCSAPDLFECRECTCVENVTYIDVTYPEDPDHVPKKDILETDYTTLAITVLVVGSLIGCFVGVYYKCHARRSSGRRIVNNTHAVFDEKLSLFDVKLRPAEGQQIYRQLGTNNVDNV